MNPSYRIISNLLWALLAITALAVPSYGQIKSEILKNAKAATALVLNGESSGTAFCLTKAGIFVTNAHVVSGVERGKSVTLILNPSEATQRKVSAFVAKVDEELDLAILQVTEKTEFTRIIVGDDKTLVETQPMIAFGYPFGKFLATKESTFPSISVNTGNITSLRKKDGKLEKIQLDAQLNPGNSGGPVLDQNGKLVGIVNSGVLASGVNFAIPVSHLKSFCSKPIINLTAPELLWQQRLDPTTFKLHPIIFGRLPANSKIQLILPGRGNESRIVRAIRNPNGSFEVTAPPLVEKERPQYVTAEFKKSEIYTKVIIYDQTIEVDSKEIRLSEIKQIGFRHPITVVNADNQILTPKRVSSFKKIKTITNQTISLSDVESISFSVLQKGSPEVSVRAEIVSNGKVLASFNTMLKISGHNSINELVEAPSSPTPIDTSKKSNLLPKTKISKKQTVELPDEIYDIDVGGSGQYLVMQFKRTREMLIFDTTKLSFSHRIPLSNAQVLFGCGSKHLVIADPVKGLINSYSLATGKLITTRKQPVPGAMQQLAMGSNSAAPFVITINEQNPSTIKFHLLSANDLQPLREPAYNALFSDDPMIVRSGSNGLTYGITRSRLSSFGILSYRTSTPVFRYNSIRPGAVIPSGKFLFTTKLGIFTDRLSSIEELRHNDPRDFVYIPSVLPKLYLRVGFAEGGQKLSIHSLDRKQALTVFPERLDEMPSEEKFQNRTAKPDPLSIEKRYHYIPSLNLLVTIPTSNSQLVLRRVDLKELTKGQDPYLSITSPEHLIAKAEQIFQYQLKHIASSEDIEYTLESGPEGMQVKPSGLIGWVAPATARSKSYPILLKASSADGIERYHVIRLGVR